MIERVENQINTPSITVGEIVPTVKTSPERKEQESNVNKEKQYESEMNAQQLIQKNLTRKRQEEQKTKKTGEQIRENKKTNKEKIPDPYGRGEKLDIEA